MTHHSALTNTPVVILIMDGWGYRQEFEGNAIAQAETPNFDAYARDYPFTQLGAAGEAVGLPEGQMGNSEVGHLNLGAGRIVYQEYTRIDKSIETGEFFANEVFLQAIERVKERNSSLHFIGLVSDGGVHSHIYQLFALLDMARHHGIGDQVNVHAVLDGRDVPPTSAPTYVEELQQYCQEKGAGRIASVAGRYYTMDRDNRWDRTRKAYDAYVYGKAEKMREDPVEAVKEAHREGENDEFVTPVLIAPEGEQPAQITSDDAIIFFNFRPDRMRQITRSFLDEEMEEMDRGNNPPFPLVITMTEYDAEFTSPIAFPPQHLGNTMGEWLGDKEHYQLRLAETEKYAHVTFFYSGGREEPFTGEERCLIPSPQVATYDLQPEMSAPEVADRACREIERRHHSLLVINFANADMVGHTGIMEAAMEAVEAVDAGVGKVVETARQEGFYVIITADHGNADIMKDPETGAPFTAHSNSNVPCILIDDRESYELLEKGGILADVAPTALELMGLPVPEEMTGKSLLVPSKGRVK